MSAEYPFDVDVQTISDWFNSKEDFILLDCREQEEFNFARIPGSVLIPMKEIPARLVELEDARNKRIVVHCHHGGRSSRVTQWLRQQGFSQAQNLAGGIDAWSQQIDPSVPRY